MKGNPEKKVLLWWLGRSFDFSDVFPAISSVFWICPAWSGRWTRFPSSWLPSAGAPRLGPDDATGSRWRSGNSDQTGTAHAQWSDTAWWSDARACRRTVGRRGNRTQLGRLDLQNKDRMTENYNTAHNTHRRMLWIWSGHTTVVIDWRSVADPGISKPRDTFPTCRILWVWGLFGCHPHIYPLFFVTLENKYIL